MHRRGRAGLLFLLVLAATGTASAHPVGTSRFDAPLPLPMLYGGAAATVVLTAALLAVTDRSQSNIDARAVVSLSATQASALRRTGRTVFFALFLAALADGLVGRQVAAENLATVFVWPLMLKGVALLSVLAGSPWRVLSPWETLYDLAVALEGGDVAVFDGYPDRLGSWPAVAGFVVLVGVVENLTVATRSPSTTVALIALYATVMVAGAVAFGREWLRRGDAFAVLFALLGRVAPVSVDPVDGGGYSIDVRPPWSGCLDGVPDASLVVFVVAAVYTVSFDGVTATQWFQDALAGTRTVLPFGAASLGLYAAGLLAFLASYAATAGLMDRLAASPGGWPAPARAFAPTVVPIAAAYELAHNYPFVAANAGRVAALAADIAAGATDTTVSPLGWLPLPAFWGSQVALIVLGHVVAVVAAHRVALSRFDSRAAARRGHAPLVALMVGYTVLSLWIVSQPVVA